MSKSEISVCLKICDQEAGYNLQGLFQQLQLIAAVPFTVAIKHSNSKKRQRFKHAVI